VLGLLHWRVKAIWTSKTIFAVLRNTSPRHVAWCSGRRVS
jgi:hypothetical protein